MAVKPRDDSTDRRVLCGNNAPRSSPNGRPAAFFRARESVLTRRTAAQSDTVHRVTADERTRDMGHHSFCPSLIPILFLLFIFRRVATHALRSPLFPSWTTTGGVLLILCFPIIQSIRTVRHRHSSCARQTAVATARMAPRVCDGRGMGMARI